MSKYLTCLFICSLCIASTAIAMDRESIISDYRTQIENKGAGVWLTSKAAYFLVDKQCLRKQKYSGTKESRAATADLLFMIGEHFQPKVFVQDQEPQILKDRIHLKTLAQSQQSINKFTMKGMLVADEDIDQCTRRRAMAFDVDSYNKAKTSIGSIDTKPIKTQVLQDAFEQNDASFMKAYTMQKGLLESFISFSINQDFMIKPVLAIETSHQKFEEHENVLQGLVKHYQQVNNCLDACQLSRESEVTTLDVGSSLKRLNLFSGMVLYDEATVLQQKVADEFYQKAEANFNRGLKPKQIFSDLSLSLLFNPNNTVALNMMGAIARALNMPQSALTLHSRALMLAPKNSKTLVHLAKTYIQLDEKEKALRYVQFIEEHALWLTPDTWASKENIRILKELK